jgi:hypothetical protein
MMISGLVEVDEQSDKAIDPSYIPIFRRQVRMKIRLTCWLIQII